MLVASGWLFCGRGCASLMLICRREAVGSLCATGRPQDVLPAVLAESGAEAIFAEEDFSRYARQRDTDIAQRLPLQLIGGLVVHPPGTLLKQDGTPYSVFTPFKKNAWLQRPLPRAANLLPAPAALQSPQNMVSDGLPAEPALPPGVSFAPGEAEAQRRLAAFSQGVIDQYAVERDKLALPGTSQLSPYLRFGMISRAAGGGYGRCSHGAGPHRRSP